MIRRSTLLAVLASFLLATSGCLGAPGAGDGVDTSPGGSDGTPTATPTLTDPAGDPPTETPTSTPTAAPVTDYDAYVFDHAGIDGPVIDGGITYDVDAEMQGKFYVTTVGTAGEAERFNHSLLPADASAFVRDTDFESSSLVVIQTFPASSYPDYRVESVRRADGDLRVAINDSSEGATADITVETVLLRVPGAAPGNVTVTIEEGTTFGATTGVTTVTPDPTPTPEPTVSLPYTATDDGENVAEPLDVRIANEGSETNGYEISIVYNERPACREETPPCGMPVREIEVLERRGKLRPGTNVTIPDVVAREGNYTVTVTGMVPAGDGERERITRTFTWTVDDDAADLLISITDDDVTYLADAP